ncbi:Cell surface Cu-only superoxide dismutase 5 [Amphibalanus amphitrite]|uniref:Cell surface Cu-only superoxide dismutase 5 n=1 Tax=Amphibalanus amphitrite TaxID=1232801 RepID=A0A6A4X5R4_AMPAM|nr:Cell surface Cu-only superoxide dismutase 5 [Amphibalanus amphitrite]
MQRIIRLFRYKGVVKQWAFNGEKEGNIKGKIEFIQESPYTITNTETDLTGLDGAAGGYHVHLVPVQLKDEFPCHNIAIGGHFNPYGINPRASPPPGHGSSDQYESGDLSGKYGELTGRSEVQRVSNDTNLQLFGPDTILGRSVVIHRAADQSRWMCGNILWGYSPAEARQVTAIASFHHPHGYAWGYIRFSQLVYHTGGRSETVIELNLRHPGSNDRNVTSGHNWAIFVNPVGHDAAVKFFTSRCTAGGYRWNPDFIHLANPNAHDFYNEQCSPETPLRCEIGDLSGRLGTIDLGQKRVVMSDPNLPLGGELLRL